MSIKRILSNWRADPSIATNIVDWRILPAKTAEISPIPTEVHPALATAMNYSGIKDLYTHQKKSFLNIKNGKNVVIATRTASGKTFCYNLPVIDHLIKNDQSTALYIYPTKALAHDQAATLSDLIKSCIRHAIELQPSSSFSLTSENISVYDGDAPLNARPGLRARARILISNPDMLHLGILPHHTSWVDFFKNLEFIVIDEMHIYRGVFGSHFTNVLRRLHRITNFYTSKPKFILASATIANPTELAQNLIQESVELVDNDGSAQGPKNLLIYNPPIINSDLNIRRSALHESVRLAETHLLSDIQSIIFGRTRRTVEILLSYLRQKAIIHFPNTSQVSINNTIRGYRSGYLPKQRRQIEAGLRSGDVRLVVATNALELGIDIGGMDAVFLVGYPGTIAASWQQMGRAGRGSNASLAVLVATADPLDQYLASNPSYFHESSPEHALINPDNLLILLDHLRCATFEIPFQVGDSFGIADPDLINDFLIFLQKDGVLHKSGSQFFWMADSYPAQTISLRSATPDRILLQLRESKSLRTIGHVDKHSANWMVHPGAIYIHEGRNFIVEDLNLEENTAVLRHIDTDYYTEPRRETTIELTEMLQESEEIGSIKTHGDIVVTSKLIGFRKIKWYTHELQGMQKISLPPTSLMTNGYWLSLHEKSVARLKQLGKWNNDPISYGPNWEFQRTAARERDNFHCQVCGVPEIEREHDVHHKTPYRTFSSYESANRLENLISLCQTCHHRAESVVRLRSGLSGLAYVLRHLAPLFLMCDRNDLGVLADPQSILGSGKPTVILYDQIPAGIGLSKRLYDIHQALIVSAFELVSSCSCIDGCPSCVGPGGELGYGSKSETLSILMVLTR